MKKIFVKTFGCQMNARDSEFATGILLENGFGIAQSIDKADVVLFNSCSVRKHAEDRLFGNIWDLKKLKNRKMGMVIGLIGCTAQSYKEKAMQRAGIIDFVCGPGNEADLPAIINKVLKTRLPVIATDKVDEKRPELFPEYRDGKFKAYTNFRARPPRGAISHLSILPCRSNTPRPSPTISGRSAGKGHIS